MKIFCQVKANAKTEKIEKTGNNEFILWVKAPAQEGKANQATLELLSHYLKLPKSCLNIIRGHKNRHKTISVLEID